MLEQMSDNPTVSVIIPVYERTDLLSDSIDSVIDQTFEDWETIIVADHQSDNDILALTQEYNDDRIKTLVDDSDGVSGARNVGIDESKGEFIAFLDSDDIWSPTKIEKQLREFERGPEELGLVYTGFVHNELDGEQWERRPKQSGDIYTKELEKDWIHPPSTVMVTRKAIEEVGGFDTTLPTREDYELWLRVTENFLVTYIDELLVTKREQFDSLSKNFDKRIEGDLAVYQEVKTRMSEVELNAVARHRIHSTHHLVIGRDYESNGNRAEAVRHLSKSAIHYPLQLNAWAMAGIAVLRINRNGPLLTYIKRILWS